jgi:glutathione S-transferase
MTLELYHASGSLCSQKVKLVLAEKRLEWKSHLLNLLTFENLSPGYMRLNPKGVVPTLIHQDRVITDSVAIVHYLEQHFPQPALVSKDAELQSKMEDWIDKQDQLPMRAIMYGNGSSGSEVKIV